MYKSLVESIDYDKMMDSLIRNKDKVVDVKYFVVHFYVRFRFHVHFHDHHEKVLYDLQ